MKRVATDGFLDVLKYCVHLANSLIKLILPKHCFIVFPFVWLSLLLFRPPSALIFTRVALILQIFAIFRSQCAQLCRCKVIEVVQLQFLDILLGECWVCTLDQCAEDPNVHESGWYPVIDRAKQERQ